MTFTQATNSAPADADYIKYTDRTGTIIFLVRSGTTWAGVAETSRHGADVVAAGISARECSLWDADAEHFISGTVAQLTKEY